MEENTLLVDKWRLNRGLLQGSPYKRLVIEELVRNQSLTFSLTTPRFPKSPIQVNLDGWENKPLESHPFIRIGAQAGEEGPGCFYACTSCVAAPFPGKNLTKEEITYQSIYAMMTGYVDLNKIQGLIVASMSTGEPFINKAVLDAYLEHHIRFPGTQFILSSTGPKSGTRVLQGAIELVNEHAVPITLHLSIGTVRHQTRLNYIGDTKGERSWTLQELGGVTQQWRRETGQMTHLNFVVGPDLPLWEEFDFAELVRLFPPSDCIIKLSLEGVYDSKRWDTKPYEKEIEVRENGLNERGYRHYRFFLKDVTVPGVSCGSQAQPRLVQVATNQ